MITPDGSGNRLDSKKLEEVRPITPGTDTYRTRAEICGTEVPLFAIIVGPFHIGFPKRPGLGKGFPVFFQLHPTTSWIIQGNSLRSQEGVPMTEEIEVCFNVTCDVHHPVDLRALVTSGNSGMGCEDVEDFFRRTLPIFPARKDPSKKGIVSKIFRPHKGAEATVNILPIPKPQFLLVVSRKEPDAFILYRGKNVIEIIHTHTSEVIKMAAISGVKAPWIESAVTHLNTLGVVAHSDPQTVLTRPHPLYRFAQSFHIATLGPNVNVPYRNKVEFIGPGFVPASKRMKYHGFC